MKKAEIKVGEDYLVVGRNDWERYHEGSRYRLLEPTGWEYDQQYGFYRRREPTEVEGHPGVFTYSRKVTGGRCALMVQVNENTGAVADCRAIAVPLNQIRAPYDQGRAAQAEYREARREARREREAEARAKRDKARAQTQQLWNRLYDELGMGALTLQPFGLGREKLGVRDEDVEQLLNIIDQLREDS